MRRLWDQHIKVLNQAYCRDYPFVSGLTRCDTFKGRSSGSGSPSDTRIGHSAAASGYRDTASGNGYRDTASGGGGGGYRDTASGGGGGGYRDTASGGGYRDTASGGGYRDTASGGGGGYRDTANRDNNYGNTVNRDGNNGYGNTVNRDGNGYRDTVNRDNGYNGYSDTVDRSHALKLISNIFALSMSYTSADSGNVPSILFPSHLSDWRERVEFETPRREDVYYLLL
ncbi:uncharacterized protein LOC128951612 [Oppia nitens]|uniref:uncharacterized protein LOC128951612 n=1 Tax=Oppia nitens TaxID=1686743 RepID=UPI0023DB2FAE|nr:uncharacterized protein LOC128951612 [Oppia nitens]